MSEIRICSKFTVIQWNAEIRTFSFQTAPKTEHRLVRTSRVRISVVRFILCSVFGFYSTECRNLNVHVRPCSDFRHKFVSEIRMICSNFRQFGLFEPIYNQTMVPCPKSEHVRISDVDCTVLLIPIKGQYNTNFLYQNKS